jgi:hypothetical protein
MFRLGRNIPFRYRLTTCPLSKGHDQRGNCRKDEFDGRVSSGRRGVGERLHFSGARDRGLSRLDEDYRALEWERGTEANKL